MDMLRGVRSNVNVRFRSWEPFGLILSSMVSSILLQKALKFLTGDDPFGDAKAFVCRWMARLPSVRDKVRKERLFFRDHMASMFLPAFRVNVQTNKALPATGLPIKDVCHDIEILARLTRPFDQGQYSGTVYNDSMLLQRLLLTVHEKFHWANPIHFTTFGGVQKLEAEVVAMTLHMFNGNENCCGTMTSGGTESILMALKAYRDRARDLWGITEPNVIVPVSAHAAVNKAGHYFGIRIIIVPVNEFTGEVDLGRVRWAINRRTIAIVGSAPSFPHGAVDDIAALSEIALRAGVGLHVDCCLGGFLVPFMEEAGFPLAPCDFRLPGVTSISCDHHKYGYAPKGSSVVMYNSQELRQYQFFSCSQWPGGLYGSSGVAGSRPGSIAAETWATMMYHGRSGYVECTKKIITVTEIITGGLKEIPGLRIVGCPQVSIVAFTSEEFDIFVFSDRLEACDWHLNLLQFPSAVHLCCTMQHTKPGVAQRFLADCRREAEKLLAHPVPPSGMTAVYGTSQRVPDRSLVDGTLKCFWEAYYTIPEEDRTHVVSPRKPNPESPRTRKQPTSPTEP